MRPRDTLGPAVLPIFDAFTAAIQPAEDIGGPERADYLRLMWAIAAEATDRRLGQAGDAPRDGFPMSAERKTPWGTLTVVWELDPDPYEGLHVEDLPPPFVFRANVPDPRHPEAASLAHLCQIGVVGPTDPYLLAVENDLLNEAEAHLSKETTAMPAIPATKTPARTKIILTDRAPVTIDPDLWPVIASADWYSRLPEVQANTVQRIRVRQHADGRRLVYGFQAAGDGGQHAGVRNPCGGFLLDADADARETCRALHRVGGILVNPTLAEQCIGDLPSEDLDAPGAP